MKEAKTGLEELGAKVFGYQVDITDRAIVYKTANRVTLVIGDIDILVNNASIVRG
ncbi:MAG: SDR family NAD(P)-dependent oxidoreductase [Spirochaetota bacterium]|nr:SDR family NAD(P)-dependent oxidoreductase [Spirochaetota bacterium]